MTRETKIGLLVGLGFIVVFAVLLSHNGSGPSPTQGLAPIAIRTAPNQQSATPLTSTSLGTSDGQVLPDPKQPGSGPELIDPITGTASAGTGSDLPSPPVFSHSELLSGDSSSAPVASGSPTDIGSGLAMVEPGNGLSLEGNMRMAPPVVEPPKPAPPVEEVRPSAPSASPPPERTTPPDAVVSNRGSTGEAVAAPAKPYVVQKGDTLVKITRVVYGKSSPDVISFVEKANKLKDRDYLREGQTLVTPPLPPSMFEQRTVSAGSSADLRNVANLINGPAGERRAPDAKPEGQSGTQRPDGGAAGRLGKPSLPVGEPIEFIRIGAERQNGPSRPEGAAGAKSDVKPEKAVKTDSKSEKPKPSSKPRSRMYEVRPKDTFSSIAQRELGSRNRWVEIQQLNKDINPTKMKPGMKIRIPSKDSLSADQSEKQASA